MEPKISIIVPVYNVEKYLSKCVDSILAQTYKNIEIILVDDGSTDLSSNICDSYKNVNGNNVIVIHKKNGGLSDARNCGIEIATGDFVGFVDSDDYIDVEMYSRMVGNAVKTNADIVVCGHRVVSVNNELIEEVVFPEDKVLSGLEATKLVLQDTVLPSFAWNKLYRKSVFDKIRFPIGRVYEDTAVIYKCFAASAIVSIIGSVFYNYVRRPDSICLNNAISEEKQIKRLFDNSRAFYERFEFAASRLEFRCVEQDCAELAAMQLLNCSHFVIKCGFGYKDKRLQNLFCWLDNIPYKNIVNLSLKKKVQCILLKQSKILFYTLLKAWYVFNKHS